MSVVEVDYHLDHLSRLSDHRGIHEHAAGTTPRWEAGYCTDDNARLLVVASREPDDDVAGPLSRLALDATLSAQAEDGRFRNRMAPDGDRSWLDEPSTGDWWGRGLWGLGVAATTHADLDVRDIARAAALSSARQRSPWLRSMAFAVLGVGELVLAGDRDPEFVELVEDFLAMVPKSGGSPAWLWPEPRLAYANGAVAEAVLLAGLALRRTSAVERGLALTDWLVRVQLSYGRLSVVGTRGRGPDERGPQFDQQPIEVAALADAFRRAWTATGDDRWVDRLRLAAAWFHGWNDTGVVMYSPQSWGGFDGLTPEGPNTNQGAESTLAFLSTMQRVRPFVLATVGGPRGTRAKVADA